MITEIPKNTATAVVSVRLRQRAGQTKKNFEGETTESRNFQAPELTISASIGAIISFVCLSTWFSRGLSALLSHLEAILEAQNFFTSAK